MPFKDKEDVYDRDKIRKRLMKKAGENYYNLAKRNKEWRWDDYFSSKDFLYLRGDREFTEEFLRFISENNNFKEKVRQDSIYRNLMMWKKYWQEPEMKEKFNNAVSAVQGRGAGRGGREEPQSGKLKRKYIFIFLFIMIAVLLLFIIALSMRSEIFMIILAIVIFPVFIFEDYVAEPQFTYMVLIWLAVSFTFFFLAIWGILYGIQNGFNRDTRRSFFYTVRKVLAILLVGIADAVLLGLTGRSVLVSLIGVVF